MLTKIEQDVFAILSELYSNAYILLIDLMETTEHRDGFRKIGRGFWLSIGDIFFLELLKTVRSPLEGIPMGFRGFRGSHYYINIYKL